MRITGAQIVVECLKEQGVKHIFGYPGGAAINIYDELYRQSDNVEHILTSHEQGAAHAADGYSRSTGGVGVCLATSGPGATNLVTGIATAYMDSIPVVAITANVAVDKLGKDSFQEVDIQGITIPVTKHNYMVKDIHQLADALREAFYIAQSGRPGPVLIDIPKNLTSEYAEYTYQEPRPIIKNKEVQIDPGIVAMIKNSKKPMIIGGGGVIRSGASEVFQQFVDKLQAATACTLMALGAMPFTHPLYTGNIGMHGSLASNRLVNECDLLIVVGGRFSDRVVGKESLFAQNAKIVHIDIDPAEINKNVVVDAYAIGDIEVVLNELMPQFEQKDLPDWLEHVTYMKREFGHTHRNDSVNVQYLLNRIGELSDENTIVATDVGQHQMWTAQHYPIMKPNRLLTSGGLGTMGYGMGAAVGAQFANPNERVILITGDGSFKMNFNEVVTAVKHHLPIKVFIMNNKTLGMVRQWQNLFYEDRFSSTDLLEEIDYVGFATALGAEGYVIDDISQIDDVINAAFASPKTCIINCRVVTDSNVYPMVEPGKGIHEAITE